MNKYMILALTALLASCGGSDDETAKFEKEQATAAQKIVEAKINEVQAAPVKKEATPCLWAGQEKGCFYVSFGEDDNKLYAVETLAGDKLVIAPTDIHELSHNNFTHYAEKIVEFAKTQGKQLTTAEVENAPKSFTLTQRGYILTVEVGGGKAYIMEDGRILAKF